VSRADKALVSEYLASNVCLHCVDQLHILVAERPRNGEGRARFGSASLRVALPLWSV
jgi:hypothetical protein